MAHFTSIPVAESAAKSADPTAKRDVASVGTVSIGEIPFMLTLFIDDAEIISELRSHEEGRPRDSFALSALRIGILALRQARGRIDSENLRNEGQRLLSDLSHELESRVKEIDTKVGASLKQYFDPNSGHFTERVERLVKKDGDLERVLREQVGDGENSELARTLARRVGERSALMRRLDPSDAESITRSIETSVQHTLDVQKEQVLREFSLDNATGALSRVVCQLEKTNGEFKGDIEQKIKQAMAEFSLDNEASALSRLVGRVEEAKNRITAEFSLDNAGSAINKLNAALSETRQAINENLTLDSEESALSRLKNQLTGVLDEMRMKNEKFQQEVSARLASLITKHEEEQRSPSHGLSFEDEFCQFLQLEAQRAGDIFTSTGSIPGNIARCKKGDAVIEMGAEATANGEKIVFEAKSNKSFALAAARQEIAEARQNRGAGAGVFVFAKDSAPNGLPPFSRIDQDLFVVWDAADATTDIYLSAAVSVAKALLFRQKVAESQIGGDIQSIEDSVNVLEKQLKGLDEMEKSTTSIQSSCAKILKQIGNIRSAADREIEQLRGCVAALKAAE